MGEAALALDQAMAGDPLGWGLRLAQQAITVLLDGGQRPGSFRVAALRAAARTRLSALSVDDRGRLERWLALQIATQSVSGASNGLDMLTTIDMTLAACVRAQLPAALISCGLGLADAADPDFYRLAGQTEYRPTRHLDAGGLPATDRPSMLSTLFR